MAPSVPDPSIFQHYFLDRYLALQAQHPSLNLNRRALLLLIADDFWSLDAQSWAALSARTTPPGSSTSSTSKAISRDSDNVVVAAEDKDKGVGEDEDEDGDNTASPPGTVLRTDYSTGSDDAWAKFCRALRDAERDFLADQEVSTPDEAETRMDVNSDVDVVAPAPQPDTEPPANNHTEEGSSDDEGDDKDNDNDELLLFTFISDPTQFNNISNLRALRLLFDLSIRAAPTPAPQHQHRLTYLRGLQETYDARGRTLWIFDSRSHADGCARLVSEAGDVATGDSWRARATHMAELQASLAARALRIDFGGLDRWDYAERQRNIREADAGYAAILSEIK